MGREHAAQLVGRDAAGEVVDQPATPWGGEDLTRGPATTERAERARSQGHGIVIGGIGGTAVVLPSVSVSVSVSSPVVVSGGGIGGMSVVLPVSGPVVPVVVSGPGMGGSLDGLVPVVVSGGTIGGSKVVASAASVAPVAAVASVSVAAVVLVVTAIGGTVGTAVVSSLSSPQPVPRARTMMARRMSGGVLGGGVGLGPEDMGRMVSSPAMTSTTRLARTLLLVACLAAGALAWLRTQTPTPRGADAPAAEFSATRAFAVLTMLLGDQAPHPVGSAENDAVRERLLAHLRAAGFEPELQTGFACNERGSCAPLVNVIVKVPGQVDGPAVVLAAHYDSVGAGPGAADDGSGTALIAESLRALQATGPHRNPLVAVWTDGEETGLLGARLLVEHPLFTEGKVAVVVNVEARGTEGASRMFETSDGNAGIVAAYADGVARPGAHSLAYEIYRLLPNDTDLTIFKRAGVQGLGNAFIGGVRRYHTPLDDLAHLDRGSLQQQGDAALGAARALLNRDLSVRTASNATYADLMGLVLLRWPAAMDLPLAIAAVVMLLAVMFVAGRRKLLSARGVIAAVIATLLAPAAGAAAGYAAVLGIEAASEPLGKWPAGWWLVLAAIVVAASAGAAATLNVVARRVGPVAQGLGTWLVWAVLGLVLSRMLPGATILPLAPALVATIGLGLAAVRPGALWPTLALAGALAFALWSPLVPALPEALGMQGLMIGAAVGWTWSAASPAFSVGQGERDWANLSAALVIAAVVLGMFVTREPRFTSDSPRKVNVVHVTDLDSGVVQYAMDAPDGVPAEVAAVVAWRVPAPVLPWSERLFHTAPAPRGTGDGPTWLASAGGPDEVKAVVKARPGARTLLLVIPGGELDALTVGGRALDPATINRGPNDTRVVTIYGPPAAGVEVTARVSGRSPWLIVDTMAGLPGGATAPVAARPATAVMWQWGDVTAAVRRVTP